jgi:hypothetical protein
MIKFFRKIRQKLVAENKFSKYLLYGIGEIVLVVIGILIALSLNNLNEDRKLQQLEKELLADIKSNLLASKKGLLDGKKLNEKTLSDYNLINHYIEHDLPFDNKVDDAFNLITFWHSPSFTFTAYESLKVKGLNLMENEELKEKLTYMYEFNFAYLIKDYDRAEWQLSEASKFPAINKHMRYKKIDENTYSGYPIDFESLKKDDIFINFLTFQIFFRDHGIHEYERVIKEIDELVSTLDKELSKD